MPFATRQGVYIVMFPSGPVGGVPSGPIKIADLTTPVPDGGAFGSVSVSGSDAVVFDA